MVSVTVMWCLLLQSNVAFPIMPVLECAIKGHIVLAKSEQSREEFEGATVIIERGDYAPILSHTIKSLKEALVSFYLMHAGLHCIMLILNEAFKRKCDLHLTVTGVD